MVIGKYGCRKSTLCNLIANFLKKEGEITIDNRDLKKIDMLDFIDKNPYKCLLDKNRELPLVIN